MIFIACLLAGAIGAAMAAELDPPRRLGAILNPAVGLVGGTLAWTSAEEVFADSASLDAFLAIFLFGGFCGAMVSMGLGSLRNILRGKR